MNEEVRRYAMAVQETIRWAIDDYNNILEEQAGKYPTFSLQAHIYWRLKHDGWITESLVKEKDEDTGQR